MANPCASSTCVEVTPDLGGTFTFTSTTEGNTGSVTYTAAEVARFLDDVKGGKWEHLHYAAQMLTATA